MKNLQLAILISVLTTNFCFAQQPIYEVTPGNGNGLRFWQTDAYKIHMGTGPEYFFGPVNDYSIKMNMDNSSNGRGWTWGRSGITPVAALNVTGNMQIAGSFTTGGDIILPSHNGNKQIYTWSSGDANWRIGMSPTPGFTTSMATSHVQYLSYSTAPGQGFAVGVNGGQSSFEITGSNHNAFFRGNLGIGTTTPGSYKLAVAGKIAADGEVRVFTDGTTSFPDYVFAPDYKLPSLEETEKYVKENRHLPEVPSAKEIEKDGMSLNEMNVILLRKVEELTLYLIEQNKIIAELKERSVSPDPSGKKVEELTLHLIEMQKEIKELRETKKDK